MAYPVAPTLLRNIRKHLAFAGLNQDATELDASEDRRNLAARRASPDIGRLLIADSRDLTTSQNPLLRINITKLARSHKETRVEENGHQPDSVGSPKKKLFSQSRCQVQLTIRHQQSDAPIGNLMLLYSDHRNARIMFSQSSDTVSSNIELDTLFEVEMSKLLVVNPKEKNWKYRMAPRYHLNITLRFLDSDDLQEFLPHIFDKGSQPSAQIHALFNSHYSTTLASERKTCTLWYQSHAHKCDTAHELHVDTQWFGTTKSCLQLLQARSLQPQVTRQADEVRFVMSVNGTSKTFTSNRFDCVFCDRKQDSAEGLDQHLQAIHKHLGFARKDFSNDGKVTIQFTIMETRSKSSKEDYLATPLHTPPHETTSGESSWLDAGKWMASKNSVEPVPSQVEQHGNTENNTLGHDEQSIPPSTTKSNIPLSSPSTAPRQTTHEISPERSPKKRRLNPSILNQAKEHRTSKGKETLFPVASTSSSENGLPAPQPKKHQQDASKESSRHVHAHMTVGRAAVADMTRTEEVNSPKPNSARTHNTSAIAQSGETVIRSPVMVHRGRFDPVSSFVSGVSSTKDFAKRRSQQAVSSTVRSPPSRISATALETNRDILRAVKNKPDIDFERGVATKRSGDRKSRSQYMDSDSNEASPSNNARRPSSTSNRSSHPNQQRHPIGLSSNVPAFEHGASGEGFDLQSTLSKGLRGSSSSDKRHFSMLSNPDQPPLPLAQHLPGQTTRFIPADTRAEVAVKEKTGAPVHVARPVVDTQIPGATSRFVARPKARPNGRIDSNLHAAKPVALTKILKEDDAILPAIQELARKLPAAKRRKYVVPAAPKGVTLFRTSTKRALVEGEEVSESEDEIDESWARRRHQDTICANRDTTAEEKIFMKRWDAHFGREQLSGNKNAASALLRFVAANCGWLCSEGMLQEFSLKVATWYSDGLIAWKDLNRCMTMLNYQGKANARKEVEGPGSQAPSLKDLGAAKSFSDWLSACSCGIPVSVTDMHRAVTCSGNVSLPSNSRLYFFHFVAQL